MTTNLSLSCARHPNWTPFCYFLPHSHTRLCCLYYTQFPKDNFTDDDDKPRKNNDYTAKRNEITWTESNWRVSSGAKPSSCIESDPLLRLHRIQLEMGISKSACLNAENVKLIYWTWCFCETRVKISNNETRIKQVSWSQGVDFWELSSSSSFFTLNRDCNFHLFYIPFLLFTLMKIMKKKNASSQQSKDNRVGFETNPMLKVGITTSEEEKAWINRIKKIDEKVGEEMICNLIKQRPWWLERRSNDNQRWNCFPNLMQRTKN